MQQLKLKLLELCMTRTNNASPDMFNFYVVLAGCDTSGLPRAGENSKPHHYKKSTKIEGPSENMFQRENSLKISDEKKNRKKILDLAQKTVERKDSESNKLPFPLQTVPLKVNKT